jgi:carbon storage regulator
MLVLSRHPTETVRLVVLPSSEPVEIEVTVVRIGPNTARLGFTAPRSVQIARAELCDQTHQEPAAA